MRNRLALVASVITAFSNSAAASICASITDGICRAVGTGIVVADDADDADRYGEAMQNAENAFRTRFDKNAPAAAIIEGVERANDLRETLRDQGVDVVLPWIGSAEKRASVSSAIRQQLRAARPELPDAALEALVAQGAAQADTQLSIDPVSEAGAIAHELCHLFLIEGFTLASEDDRQVTAHYGGTAPDWFDETAAVVCENEKLTAGRYHALKRIRDGEDGARFWPLSQYLTMTHPAASLSKRVSGKGLTVGVLTGDEARNAMTGPDGINAAYFYVQSRLFADFLYERSGNLTILGSIARNFSAGRTFPQWLRKNGRANNLPRTVSSLEADWNLWVAARLAQIE